MFDLMDFFDQPKHRSSGFNLYEEDGYVVVEAALPGVKTSNVKVTSSHGYLLIEGEEDDRSSTRKYHNRTKWSYSYRIPIPAVVNAAKDPEACFEDGVVRVVFQKGGGEGKQIPVKRS